MTNQTETKRVNPSQEKVVQQTFAILLTSANLEKNPDGVRFSPNPKKAKAAMSLASGMFNKAYED